VIDAAKGAGPVASLPESQRMLRAWIHARLGVRTTVMYTPLIYSHASLGVYGTAKGVKGGKATP
jgi:hypothetical protein